MTTCQIRAVALNERNQVFEKSYSTELEGKSNGEILALTSRGNPPTKTLFGYLTP